jgi:hypothetical protein
MSFDFAILPRLPLPFFGMAGSSVSPRLIIFRCKGYYRPYLVAAARFFNDRIYDVKYMPMKFLSFC